MICSRSSPFDVDQVQFSFAEIEKFSRTGRICALGEHETSEDFCSDHDSGYVFGLLTPHLAIDSRGHESRWVKIVFEASALPASESDLASLKASLSWKPLRFLLRAVVSRIIIRVHVLKLA
jgi:hypothetical protein